MGFFTRLFGYEGNVRFEAVTADSCKVSGKVYIESIGNSIEDIEEQLKKSLYVRYGRKIEWLKITAIE